MGDNEKERPDDVVAMAPLGEQIDNLKEDYVWFTPGVNRLHIIQCTCGNFLESGHSIDKLAKAGLRHARRSGHSINLRGN